MQPTPAAPAARRCPGHDQLAAFAVGNLPAEQVEAVAEHVTQCAACESTLASLSDAQDRLVHDLRHSAPAGAFRDEPECERLIAFARELPVAAPETTPDGPRPRWPPETPLPRRCGPYELIERLGRGGMGVVYKARQEQLHRLVAVKMLLAGAHADGQERARFRVEAEAFARLAHPHVVTIHEFGEHDGQSYFVMEYLEGGSLAGRLQEGPLPARDGARLVETLARAVHAAHQRGVIHRDLKPANVLLAADGTPKITDFGLAKLLDADNSLTRGDAVLGTASYMAPEQARGRLRDVGPATDVYALGAILYEALTGRPPFQADTRDAILEQVLSEEPEPPARLQQGLPADLEAVCLKCLAKSPARRYPSAQALADDLARWQRGEPTEARPPRGPVRVARALRRYRKLLAAAALVAVLAGGWAAWGHFQDPDRARFDIEARLAQGEPVTLIGPTGGPRWSRWVLGANFTQTSLGTEDAFSVHAWDLCLLELVHDPRAPRYRVRAEVRHERGGVQSEVGLFLTQHEYAAEKGPVHTFLHLNFNDMYPDANVWDSLPEPSRRLAGPRPEADRVVLAPLVLQDRGRGRHPSHGFGGLEPRLYNAALGKAWRNLAVEVGPDKVRGFWDGVPFGDLPTAPLCAKVKGGLSGPVAEALAGADITFHPSGSLGLYVCHASAAFRNVVVEPLTESEP